jgi:predicted GTPase
MLCLVVSSHHQSGLDALLDAFAELVPIKPKAEEEETSGFDPLAT